MTILLVTVNGEDATKGANIDVDVSDGPQEIRFKLYNTSTYLEIVDVKFVTSMPPSAFKVISLPALIPPKKTDYATIKLNPENIMALAEGMASTKEPSRFVYKIRAVYQI